MYKCFGFGVSFLLRVYYLKEFMDVEVVLFLSFNYIDGGFWVKEGI